MNIVLKKIEKDDLELLRKWRMQENVTKYMLTDPTITLKSQVEWFNKILKDDSRQDYVIVVNGVRVGYYGITNIDKELKSCEVGFYIGEEAYRGKGVFKSVQQKIENIIFNDLKLDTIIINVIEYNPILQNYLKNGYCENVDKRTTINKYGSEVSVINLYKINNKNSI